MKVTTVNLAKLIVVVLLGTAGTLLYKGCMTEEPTIIDINNTIESKQTVDEPKEKKKDQIYIQVTGEVNKPGVYYLDKGSRVTDAIAAAGGATPKAGETPMYLHKDREIHPYAKAGKRIQISLTSALDDGGQVYIPAKVTIRDVLDELDDKLAGQKKATTRDLLQELKEGNILRELKKRRGSQQ